MSTSSLPRPRQFGGKNVSITIVAATFNQEYTDALVQNCIEELHSLASKCPISIVRVPGAFEIPVTVRNILTSVKKPDIIISFGVIIKGETDHADLVGHSTCEALQQLAISTGTPIINQVLLLNNEQQAYARCIGELLNRGREGAKAAVAMLNVLNKLNVEYPQKNA